jgi:hypothetical protein
MARKAGGAKGRREARLKKRGSTSSVKDFGWLCKNTSGRVGIVSEGDSWFAYPRLNILFGPNANVMDHICAVTSSTGKANVLRLASNGDEASAMMSGPQKHQLAEILSKHGNDIQLLLFSAGGNDVVGQWDMERMLQDFVPGATAKDCIRMDRLKRKVKRVSLAYQELIELRNEYSPNTVIITHTYDRITPSASGARFLWGLVRITPWIHPFLLDRNIPKRLHLPITDILLGSLGDELVAISQRPSVKGFRVVKTRRTLRPGHRGDWVNEIHPTSSGFKKITKKIYAEMRAVEPSLPRFG